MTVGHYRSYGTRTAAVSWIMWLNWLYHSIFNQNLRSSLYSELPTWLNPKTLKKLFWLWSKNFSSRSGARKIFWSPCRGSGGMLPQKILKINVLRLAENAFPTFLRHQLVNKMLRSSSNRWDWCCLTRELFGFTAYLEILVMYNEGGRIRCILGVSWPNWKTWQVCSYWSFLAELNHFFSPFLQHEKVYSDERFLVKVRSCGHFLVSAKPVTQFMILVMNLRQIILRLNSNSPQKEPVTTINLCIFVQWCISKAVLWPPILICERYLLLNSAGGLGVLWAPVGLAESWWGPGEKPLETLKTHYQKGSKISLSR